MARILQRYESISSRDDASRQFHKVEIVGTPGRGVKYCAFRGCGREECCLTCGGCVMEWNGREEELRADCFLNDFLMGPVVGLLL